MTDTHWGRYERHTLQDKDDRHTLCKGWQTQIGVWMTDTHWDRYDRHILHGRANRPPFGPG